MPSTRPVLIHKTDFFFFLVTSKDITDQDLLAFDYRWPSRMSQKPEEIAALKDNRLEDWVKTCFQASCRGQGRKRKTNIYKKNKNAAYSELLLWRVTSSSLLYFPPPASFFQRSNPESSVCLWIHLVCKKNWYIWNNSPIRNIILSV